MRSQRRRRGPRWSAVQAGMVILSSSYFCPGSPASCGVNGTTAYCASTNGSTAFCKHQPTRTNGSTTYERTCTACKPVRASTLLGGGGFYEPPSACGCTDQEAPNYDPTATHEDGTCDYDDLCVGSAAAGGTGTLPWFCWTSGGATCAAGACGAPGYGTRVNSSLYNRTWRYKLETRPWAGTTGQPVYMFSSHQIPVDPLQRTRGPLPIGARMDIADQAWHLMRYVRFDSIDEAHPELNCVGCQASDVLQNGDDAITVAGFAGGGALTIRENVKLLISVGVFYNCTNRAGQGGAIKVTSATLLLRHVIFEENSAPGAPISVSPQTELSAGGGAIFVEFSIKLDIAFSQFINNVAWDRTGQSGDSWKYRYDTTSAYGGHIAGRALGDLNISYTTFDPAPAYKETGYGTVLYGRDMVDVGGVQGGCNQHPCRAGQFCLYLDWSLSCHACPSGQYGDDGIECSNCGAGKGPELSTDTTSKGFYTGCEACAQGEYSSNGVCQTCPQGKQPDDQSSACVTCSVGWDSDEAGNTSSAGLCTVCLSSYYGALVDESLLSSATAQNTSAIQAAYECLPCEDLELPPRLVAASGSDQSSPSLTRAGLCPGGLPSESVICPQEGIWVHWPPNQPTKPQLLACENAHSCRTNISTQADGTSGCAAWIAASPLGTAARSAECAPLHRGFRCAHCTDEAVKIKGVCRPCPGVQWKMVALDIAIKFCTAFFLFHKSTAATFSAHDVRLIWHKVDTDHDPESPAEECVLGKAGVRQVLALLGLHPSEKKLDATMHKEYLARTRAHRRRQRAEAEGVGGVVAVEAKARGMEEGPEDELLVDAEVFCRIESAKSPTASLGIAIFFLQTFALIARGAGFADSLGVANLNTEEAAQMCVSPLDHRQRFLFTALVSPLMLLAFVPLAHAVWGLLRRHTCARVWEGVLLAPPRPTRIHAQRTMLNLFLFLYAPVTKSAIEVLVCITPQVATDAGDSEPCSGPECVPVLAFEHSTQCFDSSWWITALAAALVLVAYVLVVPLALLRKAGRAKHQRDFSLGLRSCDVTRWFDELDEDSSGSLERQEVAALLERMHERSDAHALTRVMAVIDPDASGQVSRPEFDAWYGRQITSLIESPFDVLYGTTTSREWWWFAQVLYLKTAINICFTFGYHHLPDSWHMAVHVVLACSLFLMVNRLPYISRVDHQVELLGLLCLATFSHLSAVRKSGEAWGAGVLTLAATLFLIPFCALTGLFGRELLARKRWRAAAELASQVAVDISQVVVGKTIESIQVLRRRRRHCCCCCCANNRGTAVVAAVVADAASAAAPAPAPALAEVGPKTQVGSEPEPEPAHDVVVKEDEVVAGMAASPAPRKLHQDEQLVDDFVAEEADGLMR